MRKAPRWSVIRNVLHWVGQPKKEEDKVDLKKEVEKQEKKDDMLKKIPIVSDG